VTTGPEIIIARAGLADPSRRAVLKAGAAITGTLLLSFHLPFAQAAPAHSQASSGLFAPNAFIRIDRQGRVTLVMPQVEMGQGVYTAVAMILAEELDAAWEKVALEAAPYRRHSEVILRPSPRSRSTRKGRCTCVASCPRSTPESWSIRIPS
jgi:CO/xanthine dehydrogenase Mo-binding subunit